MIEARTPGSRTDKKNRKKMIDGIQSILEKKAIIFFQKFVISNYISNVANVKEEIKDQFRTFSREIIIQNDPEKKNKIRYHGKIKGKNDDFVLATIINMDCAVKIMSNPRYKKLI